MTALKLYWRARLLTRLTSTSLTQPSHGHLCSLLASRVTYQQPSYLSSTELIWTVKILAVGQPKNTLRFEDEFVRHKILDAVGDLALVGAPISGHLVVQRGGHALHTAFGRLLLDEPDAWDLVEAPSEVFVPGAVAVGTDVAS